MMEAQLDLKLRPARPEEAAALTDLCLRSKASWGYDRAFMDACRQELTLTATSLATEDVALAERDGHAVGLVQLALDGDVAVLDKLFVSPDSMGEGVGRSLFSWATSEATRRGARVLLIEADPDAADFYRHMGAADDGQVASGSIPGRFLPRLRVAL